MLTREDDVDAHALHRRGWTISAIARHLGHDRKTIRAYLRGGRVAGQRSRVADAGPARQDLSLRPSTRVIPHPVNSYVAPRPRFSGPLA
jgi:IS30 family transposase